MYPQVNKHVSKWKLLEPAWTLTSHRTKKTLRIDDIYELSSQKVEIQVPNMLGYYMYLHLEEEAKVFVFNHVMT